MATPEVLARKPESIGKPVRGVVVASCQRVETGSRRQVGRPALHSQFLDDEQEELDRDPATLAFRDAEGDILLCGRIMPA